ncbi:LLM class flavin-dependent oxidoreductase [Brachybacterium hainanense]|uniref:LLM class flavin-dependent oxidoreductase n=1 Tax=Brachybacterium hainanense TaxID=1541174 RepID=A0ABV6RBI4_9MICO
MNVVNGDPRRAGTREHPHRAWLSPTAGSHPPRADRPAGRTRIGFHASHEQIPPEELLRLVVRAEAVGFDGAMCSDHLAPWGIAQGSSGHAWTWLGAALASTGFPIGVVTAPGQRYHPAVLAQAIGTLGRMFPGRFWAACGSGEALNEHVTGDPWPDHEARDDRLLASVDVIRRLLAGEEVDADGPVRVHRARVWSRPAAIPPTLAAAVSTRTAGWAASWADGLITTGCDPRTTGAVRRAYRSRGGRGPLVLQVHLALADSAVAAGCIAREQWRQATVPPALMWDLQQPEDFDSRATDDPGSLAEAVALAGSVAELVERVVPAAAGYDEVHLHHVGTDQERFLDRCPELLRLLRARLPRIAEDGRADGTPAGREGPS